MRSHALSVYNCLKIPLHCPVDTHFVVPVSRIIGKARKKMLFMFVHIVVRVTLKNQNSKRMCRVRTPPGKSLKLLQFNSYPGMSWNMLKNPIELLKTP